MAAHHAATLTCAGFIGFSLGACAPSPSPPSTDCGGGSADSYAVLPVSLTFSFEGALDGWQPRGLDTALGQGHIEWNISPSDERATNGHRSLKFFLVNHNDAGKIFIQRTFEYLPDGSHIVNVSFDIASADLQVNAFQIIAGVLQQRPAFPHDLRPAFQETTWHGTDKPEYVWMKKKYAFSRTSAARGCIVVVVGVWGTHESPRTYFIDNVSVEISKR